MKNALVAILTFGLICSCAVQGNQNSTSSSTNDSKILNDLGNQIKGFIGGPQAIPDEAYKEIQFQRAINKAFKDQLVGTYFKFKALYKGTSPDPGKFKRLRGYVNLNICDLNINSVCSDLIVIKDSESDAIFTYNENQKVEIYGEIIEPGGMSIGDSDVSWSQLPGKAPYNFIVINKIIKL